MIPYFETHICEQCNLKCRGCSHFSVFAKPKYKDLGEFTREFQRLSEIEEIGIIRLMGGEPLLNPDWMEYVRVARQYFPNSKIVLVSNGLLGHKIEPYIEELDSLDIDVTFSDYHLDKQEKDILNRVKYTELHEKGRLYNISLSLYPHLPGEEAFGKCDLKQNHWHYFQDGRFYPCCIAGTIGTFMDHFKFDFGFKQEELGIDIFTHSKEEIEDWINKPCKLCTFCRTDIRQSTYQPFGISKGDIKEWTI